MLPVSNGCFFTTESTESTESTEFLAAKNANNTNVKNFVRLRVIYYGFFKTIICAFCGGRVAAGG